MRGKVVIFAQFGFIVLFVYALSSEYQSNQYQQGWIAENASPLQYLLNGYAAAALIGVFIGGAVLLLSTYLKERKETHALKTAI